MMKITVKKLKGTSFTIDAKPQDTVADLKKKIETAEGANHVYPAARQMLIHRGKVLKDDETTLEESNLTENGFVVVMLAKNKSISGEASTAATQEPQTSSAPVAAAPSTVVVVTPSAAVPSPTPASSATIALPEKQAASVEAIGNNVIQQILDLGDGTWDRDTVVRALAAAHNNPERAVTYLHGGIPDDSDEQSEVAVNPQSQNVQATQQPTGARGPNTNPLNMFPQDDAANAIVTAPTNLETQMNAFHAMVNANPQRFQRWVEVLSTRHPRLAAAARSDRERQADVEGREHQEGNFNLTFEDLEAIERLESLGFERALVIEVFMACDKNEEQAANYLLDHLDEH